MPPLDLYDVGFVGAVGAIGRNTNVTVNDGSTDGTKTTSGGKDYYKFTSSGDFVVSAVGGTDPVVKVMLIGGGGQGVLKYYGSGSGAGGMFFDDVVVSAQTYAIVIGGSQTDSTGFGKTALKGAHGQSGSDSATAGGCGCGNLHSGALSDDYTVGDQSTSASGGIGYNGGGAEDTTARSHAGGGGGLGANGTYGFVGTGGIGNGGDGANNTFCESILSITTSGIDESGTRYIGGGGGAAANLWSGASTGGVGGKGGGGDSGFMSNAGGGSGGEGGCAESPLPANCGGGGGAAGRSCSTRPSGGSGLCVVVVG